MPSGLKVKNDLLGFPSVGKKCVSEGSIGAVKYVITKGVPYLF